VFGIRKDGWAGHDRWSTRLAELQTDVVRDQLRVGTFNVRGLKRTDKIDIIIELLLASGLHAVGLQETWINSQAEEELVGKKLDEAGFEWLHRSRYGEKDVGCLGHGGGGVAVVLKKGWGFRNFKLEESVEDALLTSFFFGQRKFFFLSLYRTPQRKGDKQRMEKAKSLMHKDNIIVTGDVNGDSLAGNSSLRSRGLHWERWCQEASLSILNGQLGEREITRNKTVTDSESNWIM
jgi:hypothetical protein